MAALLYANVKRFRREWEQRHRLSADKWAANSP
jgi:hypothetical protein